MKVLVLKDNYNSFEQYYIDEFIKSGIDACQYYKSNTPFRKLFTHYGLPFDCFFYGDWNTKIDDYDLIIVFDSIHTVKLLKYLRARGAKRVIFWHWNPIRTAKEAKLLEQSREYCENWTFNPADADKYRMQLNNQFYFYQTTEQHMSNRKVFFVGADKGRYSGLLKIKNEIEKCGYEPDFNIIVKDASQYADSSFCRTDYMDYTETLSHIRGCNAMLELTQNGQSGLTARALEAMFHGKKLITDNESLLGYDFYCSENIFILGKEDRSLEDFLQEEYVHLCSSKLFKYSAKGWLENFVTL